MKFLKLLRNGDRLDEIDPKIKAEKKEKAFKGKKNYDEEEEMPEIALEEKSFGSEVGDMDIKANNSEWGSSAAQTLLDNNGDYDHPDPDEVEWFATVNEKYGLSVDFSVDSDVRQRAEDFKSEDSDEVAMSEEDSASADNEGGSTDEDEVVGVGSLEPAVSLTLHLPLKPHGVLSFPLLPDKLFRRSSMPAIAAATLDGPPNNGEGQAPARDGAPPRGHPVRGRGRGRGGSTRGRGRGRGGGGRRTDVIRRGGSFVLASASARKLAATIAGAAATAAKTKEMEKDAQPRAVLDEDNTGEAEQTVWTDSSSDGNWEP